MVGLVVGFILLVCNLVAGNAFSVSYHNAVNLMFWWYIVVAIIQSVLILAGLVAEYVKNKEMYKKNVASIASKEKFRWAALILIYFAYLGCKIFGSHLMSQGENFVQIFGGALILLIGIVVEINIWWDTDAETLVYSR